MDIMNELMEKMIIFGINKPLLKKLTENSFPVGEYLIAEGTVAVNGKDSRVECMVKITPPPLEVDIENENNKYFPIRITNVRKGQRLLRLTKATSGTPGYNVFGESIACLPGKNLPFTRGKNTAYSDDEKNYLIATENGNFVYDEYHLEVESDYNVNGDISTLNGQVIECYGNLIVQGDVRVGVTLKVDGNLTVMGSVEEVVIECGGNVDVKVGLHGGKGFGKIIAYGDVSFFHGNNHNVISRSTIKIGKMAMNCNLTAQSIDSPKALICGGSTLAFQKIEVYELGKENYAKTTVTLGGKLNNMILSNEREAEIGNLLRQVHLCNNKLEYLIRVTSNLPLTPQQEEGMHLVQHAYEQLNDLLDRRKEEYEKLRSDLRGINLKLIVRGTIHETVHLVMNDLDVKIFESISGVIFTEKNYRIIRERY
jgi:uncharacterized protein (DUF342 family)